MVLLASLHVWYFVCLFVCLFVLFHGLFVVVVWFVAS